MMPKSTLNVLQGFAKAFTLSEPLKNPQHTLREPLANIGLIQFQTTFNTGLYTCKMSGGICLSCPTLIFVLCFYLCSNDIHFMTEEKQANNPLHGKTLEFILKQLVWHYGWPELGQLIKIACFNNDPSLKSSLTFLRKTDWARKKVEKLYLNTFH